MSQRRNDSSTLGIIVWIPSLVIVQAQKLSIATAPAAAAARVSSTDPWMVQVLRERASVLDCLIEAISWVSIVPKRG